VEARSVAITPGFADHQVEAVPVAIAGRCPRNLWPSCLG
jgi:hypothetical protein